jgi:hypothetical protein
MPSERPIEPLGGWSQLALLPPTHSRIECLVHLDGPGGKFQYSTLVQHGLDRSWVAADVVPVASLDDIVTAAVEAFRTVLEVEVSRVSPF